jgi:phosphoenolpyruvate carboxylase
MGYYTYILKREENMSKFEIRKIKAQTLKDLLELIESKVAKTEHAYATCQIPNKDAEDYIAKVRFQGTVIGRHSQMEELKVELKELLFKEMTDLLGMNSEGK